MAPCAVLVGAPGSGKSTVGLALAEKLGVEFRDTDSDLEAEFGMSIADQFVIDGEPAFRLRERAAVSRALQEHSGVLALGGGAVLADETRQLLAVQRVIWLRVSAAEAAKRVGMGVSRPLLLGNVRATLVTLLNDRTPLYAQVADTIVDSDDRSPDEIVFEIIAQMPELQA